jgi:hypothetical protein
MSLRAFHIIFITVVTLFCLGVAIWALYVERQSQDITFKILGYSCAVASIFLPIYGFRFYKKSASNFN